MKRNPIPFVALALLLGLGACSRKPQPIAAPAAPRGVEAEDAARRAAEERARREAEAAEARRLAELARTRALLENMVFFDYDSFDIRADSREVLDAKVPLLRADPALRLTIAGHADERGSTEYNIALGMRRAVATREYLAAFGIDPARMVTLSYGEEQPLEAGQAEGAYARNRRAEFRLGGPGER